uniref:Uncharacterized protein n=1 Tax=Caenorhabditis japonica TaxID=281687 RepID=A0A8R1E5Z7_CAEJA
MKLCKSRASSMPTQPHSLESSTNVPFTDSSSLWFIRAHPLIHHLYPSLCHPGSRKGHTPWRHTHYQAPCALSLRHTITTLVWTLFDHRALSHTDQTTRSSQQQKPSTTADDRLTSAVSLTPTLFRRPIRTAQPTNQRSWKLSGSDPPIFWHYIRRPFRSFRQWSPTRDLALIAFYPHSFTLSPLRTFTCFVIP